MATSKGSSHCQSTKDDLQDDDLGSDHIWTPPSKIPRLDIPVCLVYIVEKKISSGHLSHLKGIANKKGFSLATILSDDVTHIITTLPTYERLKSALPGELPASAEIVTLEWLTTSFAEGKPTQVTDRYRLHKTVQPDARKIPPVMSSQNVPPFQIPEYECQRATLLEHYNHVLTDALELLERYYQHLDHKQGDTRALAYRQASCTLKVLPMEVKNIKEVVDLPRIGKHSTQVIQDILLNGSSQEVDECRKSEWFQCMELFTSVYGCGSATADKWYQKGLRSIQDVKSCKEIQLTPIQKLGLAYYKHLSVPVNKEETKIIVSYVQSQLDVCVPGTKVEAVGGYRRGKPHGHDVDLLLTHSDTCVVDTILDSLLAHLQKQDVLVHSDVSKGHNVASNVQRTHMSTPRHNQPSAVRRGRATFDYLDKAFSILSIHDSPQQGEESDNEEVNCDDIGGPSEGGDERSTSRLIKRVDFIVSPPKQYPFALVSWTGSKQFNRSLRRYSAKELNMTVTAHGVYDIGQQKYLPATTEEEVFALLKLEYREPHERNC